MKCCVATDRNHYRQELRALGLVDGDCVSRRDVIQLTVVAGHQTVVVPDEDLLLDMFDLLNGADVAIENFFLVVVLCLNDFIANLEGRNP
jgi:hypothetical protein